MKIPSATYRLQFHRNFNLQDARSLLEYFDTLGISDVYASPIFKARPGSMHGYDVTDPTCINPEVGAAADFDAFVRELKRHRMGLIIDIVPNHMAAATNNPYWRDVLEHGQTSRYASFFDIDWSAPSDFLDGKVMLPILGAPAEAVLENQEITLSLEPHGFVLHYYEHEIPLDPRSYRHVLTLDSRRTATEWDAGDRTAFEALQQSIGRLGPRSRADKEEAIAVEQHSRSIKERLWQLYNRSSAVRAYLDENISRFNGAHGKPEGARLLSQLLADQAYRVCYWRKALEEINYRRFFDINDLIAVRVEDPEVAEATHELALRWIREGKIQGLRIDHIDGLYDPAAYLEWLQRRACNAGSTSDFYVVVEKILTGGEELRATWQAAGTTGYEFIAAVNGVFLNGSGLAELRRFYESTTNSSRSFADVRYEMKKRVTAELFASEVARLERQLLALAGNDETACTIEADELSCALSEISACLPVYRTYAGESEIAQDDRRRILAAIGEAQTRNGKITPRTADFLRRLLLLETELRSPAGERADGASRFVRRWQQLTGPLMAKGLEDTTHYVYNCLISQNEVGCDPAHALGREQFHAWSKSRQEKYPYSLNATATHDTKRGEDVRARIHVISELAAVWEQHVGDWQRQNRHKRQIIDGETVPDTNAELFLYQTLIGAWPFSTEELPQFKERVKAYMIKAAREGKIHSSWLDVNEPYEAALVSFVDGILDDRRSNPFLESFCELQQKIAFYGALNGLSQLLVKIAAPGVPDFYQGTELWDLNLVDPDNRRPVDFVTRQRSLSDMKDQNRNVRDLITDLLAHWRDGRIKLYVTYRSLGFRKSHPRAFLEADYVPLPISEGRQRHLLAFARRAESVWVVAVVPRLLTSVIAPGEWPLGEVVWSDTRVCLPAGTPEVWTNVLTGETLHTEGADRKSLRAAGILRHLPVALLAADVNAEEAPNKKGLPFSGSP